MDGLQPPVPIVRFSDGTDGLQRAVHALTWARMPLD